MPRAEEISPEHKARVLRGLLRIIDNDERTSVAYADQCELFRAHINQEGYGLTMRQAECHLKFFLQRGGVAKRDDEAFIHALWRGKSACVPREALVAIGYTGAPARARNISMNVAGSSESSMRASTLTTSTISTLYSVSDVSIANSRAAVSARQRAAPYVPARGELRQNSFSTQHTPTKSDREPPASRLDQHSPGASDADQHMRGLGSAVAPTEHPLKRSSQDAELVLTSPRPSRQARPRIIMPDAPMDSRNAAVEGTASSLADMTTKSPQLLRIADRNRMRQTEYPAYTTGYQDHDVQAASKAAPPPISSIDLTKLPKRTVSLHDTVRDVFTSFLDDALQLPANQTCPKPAGQDTGCVAMFLRCLGPDWSSQIDVLRRRNLPTALNLLPSMFNALLYERIFQNGLNWQLELCREIGLFGGEDHIRIVLCAATAFSQDISLATSRQVEAVIAQVLAGAIGQSSAVFVSYVAKLAADMLETMLPLLQRLETIASNLNGDLKTHAWRSDLLEAFTTIVEKAMRMKVDLCKAAEEHKFVWPANGETFDSTSMKRIEAGSLPSQPCEVTFTVFPGLEVYFPSQQETKRPCLAIVASRVRAAKQGGSSNT